MASSAACPALNGLRRAAKRSRLSGPTHGFNSCSSVRCLARSSISRDEAAAQVARPSTTEISGASEGSEAIQAAPRVARAPLASATTWVHLTHMPYSTRLGDIYRACERQGSLHRMGDLQAIHFLRTATLLATGQAVANFNTAKVARDFQRSVDGFVMNNQHIRAAVVPSPAQARDLIRSNAASNLSSMFVRLLVSQSSGTVVLLRGLPPALYVTRLYEALQKGYSLAPPTKIRQGRKTAHLRPLFDTSELIWKDAKAELRERKEEVNNIAARRRKVGLSGLLASLEEDRKSYTSRRARSPAFGQASDDTQGDELDPAYDPMLPFAPTRLEGIEGPDLRVEGVPGLSADNPYGFTSAAKVFWDTIWTAAQSGRPYEVKSLSGTGKDADNSPSLVSIPFLPIIKLPYPSVHHESGKRAWFVVRLTDAADAHRLVRRWNNMYYSEREFGLRYLCEAEVLY